MKRLGRVCVLFLLFSLSFWFMMLPNPVLATTGYTMDFDDYVIGNMVDEDWLVTETDSPGSIRIDNDEANSGSYSMDLNPTSGGGHLWWNFTNRDFESISFYCYFIGAYSTYETMPFYFYNQTGSVMCGWDFVTLDGDGGSGYGMRIRTYDGTDTTTVIFAIDEDTSIRKWCRVSCTKLTDNTFNVSFFDEDNNFICGGDDGMSDVWSNWNGTLYCSGNTARTTERMYIDDLSYNGGDGDVGTATGNVIINCYNESSGNAITNWSLKIYDEYGGIYYNNNDLSNPAIISHSVYGTGETYFQFGASNYSNRTYYADIVNGYNYTLDAYLPYADNSNLYYVKVVNGYDDDIRDAEIHISQSVGSDLVEVASGFTNSYGSFATNLISDNEYYINISHSDYDDIILDSLYTDPVYYGSNYPIVYVMTFTSIDYDNESDWQDEIGFTGYLSGDTLYVNYSDSSTNTVNTSIIVYEINGSSYNQIGWDNRTGDNSFQYSLSSVNSSNCYEVHLFLNHSDYGYIALYLIICPGSMDYRDLTNKSTWDDLFDLNYGTNPFGWSNCFAFFIMTMTLFSFSSRNSGIGVVLTGFLLLFVNMIIGFHIMGVTVPVLFILFGFLSQWNIHRREWG